MKSVPFPQLQAFLVVARQRSFSGAGRELGVSRSAVSQAVRQLEERLRVVLLARTTRSVSLTDAGRKLVESAGAALAQVLADGESPVLRVDPDEVANQVIASTVRARQLVGHDAQEQSLGHEPAIFLGQAGNELLDHL